MGEIPTPIILLKDRLIGDKGGEELLEERKEGIIRIGPLLGDHQDTETEDK